MLTTKIECVYIVYQVILDIFATNLCDVVCFCTIVLRATVIVDGLVLNGYIKIQTFTTLCLILLDPKDLAVLTMSAISDVY